MAPLRSGQAIFASPKMVDHPQRDEPAEAIEVRVPAAFPHHGRSSRFQAAIK